MTRLRLRPMLLAQVLPLLEYRSVPALHRQGHLVDSDRQPLLPQLGAFPLALQRRLRHLQEEDLEAAAGLQATRDLLHRTEVFHSEEAHQKIPKLLGRLWERRLVSGVLHLLQNRKLGHLPPLEDSVLEVLHQRQNRKLDQWPPREDSVSEVLQKRQNRKLGQRPPREDSVSEVPHQLQNRTLGHLPPLEDSVLEVLHQPQNRKLGHRLPLEDSVSEVRQRLPLQMILQHQHLPREASVLGQHKLRRLPPIVMRLDHHHPEDSALGEEHPQATMAPRLQLPLLVLAALVLVSRRRKPKVPGLCPLRQLRLQHQHRSKRPHDCQLQPHLQRQRLAWYRSPPTWSTRH